MLTKRDVANIAANKKPKLKFAEDPVTTEAPKSRTFLTDEQQNEIVAICHCLPRTFALREAARYTGVDYDVLVAAVKRDTAFGKRCRKAFVSSKVAALERIYEVGMGKFNEETKQYEKGQWTALSWFLERSYPDQYGRSVREDLGKEAAKLHAQFQTVMEKISSILVQYVPPDKMNCVLDEFSKLQLTLGSGPVKRHNKIQGEENKMDGLDENEVPETVDPFTVEENVVDDSL